MPFTPEQLRKHRERLYAQGFCTSCHKPNPEAPMRTCPPCRARTRTTRRRWRRARRASGGCEQCASDDTVLSTLCAPHAAARRRIRAVQYERRRDEGRCVKCGGAMPPETRDFKGTIYRRCAICLEQERWQETLRRAL